MTSLGTAGGPTGRRRRAAILLALVAAGATAGSVQADDAASIGASVRVLAIEVGVELSTAQARVGDKVRAEAVVTNVGTVRIAKVVLELRIGPGVSIKGPTAATVSQLQPGRTASTAWTLCALQPGNYLVLVRATVDGVALDSQARLLTVTNERKKGCS